MKTIWKFPLSIDDEQKLMIPKPAIIRKAAIQDNQLCLWVEVDTLQAPEEKTIYIYGTGQSGLRDWHDQKFIDTVIAPPYVWHVYEGRDL